ncbi:hypothetical protein ACHWQZ_G019166 [Mnemiopsis leidyi]
MLLKILLSISLLGLPPIKSDQSLKLQNAIQSTTGFGGFADKAIDGNTNGNYFNWSCTHTQASRNNWWAAELEVKTEVNMVLVYPRMDYHRGAINGAKVYVDEQLCGMISYVKNKTSYTVRCANLVGKTIKLTLSTHYLMLCEVQAFKFVSVDGGWTDTDTWSSCTKRCGTGTQNRTRTCTDPVPQHGGADCVGIAFQTRDCNTRPCPSKIFVFISDVAMSLIVKLIV